MKYNKTLKLAQIELQSSKIWKTNYEPPYLKFLYTLGVKAIPPHYKSFKENLLHDSIGMGAGTLIVLFIWLSLSKVENTIFEVLISSLFIGAIFGLFMGFLSALYYLLSAKSNKLSTWFQLQNK